jgi:hypothetical protein
MSNLKRYNIYVGSWQDDHQLEIEEEKDGEWVKFEEAVAAVKMYEITKEFRDLKLVDLYKQSGVEEVFKKIHDFIESKREEIVLAWWAEHGFAPGRAVLVHGFEDGESVCYIRKCTAEEERSAGLQPTTPAGVQETQLSKE